MADGDIVVLENTRFRGAEETKNGEAFAKELADLVDDEVFVMDAFGSAHRAHASTAGVTKFVKETAVGYLMQKEINYLGNAVETPVRPFVAILGGAKVADKLNVIQTSSRSAIHLSSAAVWHIHSLRHRARKLVFPSLTIQRSTTARK